MFDIEGLGKKAKKASFCLLKISDKKINSVLKSVADSLIENSSVILKANKTDIINAKNNGKSDSFIDRLTLTVERIKEISKGVEQVALLPSPVNKVTYKYENGYQGIKVVKRKVPFGVVGMIYEARPNVTVDAFSLCFKTKNAVILRGGSDAINTNIAIVNVIKKALKGSKVNEDVISLIEDTSHETALKFMKANNFVDLLIPRGGAGLINSAIENSTIPIIQTGTGNCHIYVDEFADFNKAVNVIFNAKTQRYSVCNACESLCINEKVLDKVLPKIYKKLSEKQVEFRCDKQSYQVLKGNKNVQPAVDKDFYTEYCDAIISVKTVKDVKDAIKHINKCSTRHSEAIITENVKNANLFMKNIDSSCVYHNASTRFSDGFVFGLGAEIGISTQKMHARGPMGLDALTTTKYFVVGDGAVRK